MTGPRVLFSVPGKRGLGHVMRGRNVARAIRALAPDAHCVFVSRGESVREVIAEEFEVVVVEPEDDRPAAVVGAELVRPDVIVHDTALPSDVPMPDVAHVYIMRRSLPERQAEVLASPQLRAMSLILVPHTREDFGYEIPADLVDRCLFVGPISQRPTPAGGDRARDRYDAHDRFLVTSTVGGGGFQAQAEAFFACTAALQQELAAHLPGARHVIVRGPNFTGRADPSPGAREVDFDPELVELLGASDLVVAEGGYNTVLEVRLARVPAVFLPSVRTWDDQERRVRDLERAGLAAVLIDPDPTAAAAHILARATDATWLAGVRRRYADEPLETGNRAAAEALIELAGHVGSRR